MQQPNKIKHNKKHVKLIYRYLHQQYIFQACLQISLGVFLPVLRCWLAGSGMMSQGILAIRAYLFCIAKCGDSFRLSIHLSRNKQRNKEDKNHRRHHHRNNDDNDNINNNSKHTHKLIHNHNIIYNKHNIKNNEFAPFLINENFSWDPSISLPHKKSKHTYYVIDWMKKTALNCKDHPSPRPAWRARWKRTKRLETCLWPMGSHAATCGL